MSIKQTYGRRIAFGLMVVGVAVLILVRSVSAQPALAQAGDAVIPFVYSSRFEPDTSDVFGGVIVFTGFRRGRARAISIPARPFVRSCYMPSAGPFSVPWWV